MAPDECPGRHKEDNMSKQWANRGFEDPPDYGDYRGSGGDGGPRTFKFYIPPPPQGGKPVYKRILFLDSDPFAFWEHGLYKLTGKSRDMCICLGRTGLDDRGCPLCDAEYWPRYMYYLSVIELGTIVGWKDTPQGRVPILEGYTPRGKDVTYQFDRKYIGMGRGSDDKPGVGRKMMWQREQRGGDLTGTVWDVGRSGKLIETCGDDWNYVTRVAQKDWASYLASFGANSDDLQLSPVDYYEIFKPDPYEKLERLVHGGGWDSGGGQGGATTGQQRTEGAGYGGGQQGGGYQGGPQGGGQQQLHGQGGSPGYGPGDPGDDIPF